MSLKVPLRPSAAGPTLKVCCIGSLDEARLAMARGAGWLGLVSAMPSGPGVIDEPLIAQIAAAVPPTVQTVLLTARTDADAIEAQLAQVRTTAVQLVDACPEAELRRLRRRCPDLCIVPVVHVQDEQALDQARAWAPWSDAILLDSGAPQAAVRELGGTGRTHDWSISARVVQALAPHPVFLAGGLHAGNLAQAWAAVRPFGFDVCSGVRREGCLDEARLSALTDALASLDRRTGPDS